MTLHWQILGYMGFEPAKKKPWLCGCSQQIADWTHALVDFRSLRTQKGRLKTDLTRSLVVFKNLKNSQKKHTKNTKKNTKSTPKKNKKDTNFFSPPLSPTLAAPRRWAPTGPTEPSQFRDRFRDRDRGPATLRRRSEPNRGSCWEADGPKMGVRQRWGELFMFFVLQHDFFKK